MSGALLSPTSGGALHGAAKLSGGGGTNGGEDQAGSFERVDPALVPSVRLANGTSIPAIGMGTFGSDSVPAEKVAVAVSDAAAMGYRHFDCAAVYGNEAEIGAALKGVMASGLKRQELFITSKLWNDKHDEGDVIPAFEASLRALGLDYLDLYLIHWPFPNHHAPGVDVSARAGNAQPYRHEAYMKIWRQLESLADGGLVRSIGTSNMSVAKLELLLRDARIRPAVNELELHPHFQQPELCAYLSARGIQPIAYSPLGSPGRPERDRTPEDSVDIEDPVIRAIAARRGEHPAAVCLRWAIQRGHIPIPFSASRRNLLANLRAAVSEPLLPEDMAAIGRIDRRCRLIKGQVFLWKEGQSWEDLWDMDGIIRS